MARLSGQLDIVAVGKLRRQPWLAVQEDYLKRLRRYTSVQLFEVKDVVGRRPDAVALQREGESLLRAAGGAHCRIALTPAGREWSSPELAAFLQRRIEIYGRLAFLIGGPAGLSPEVLDACDVTLALSRLTFPHELSRILLLEQLYRAATILSGDPYHK